MNRNCKLCGTRCIDTYCNPCKDSGRIILTMKDDEYIHKIFENGKENIKEIERDGDDKITVYFRKGAHCLYSPNYRDKFIEGWGITFMTTNNHSKNTVFDQQEACIWFEKR